MPYHHDRAAPAELYGGRDPGDVWTIPTARP
jgi:hypothetical protein